MTARNISGPITETARKATQAGSSKDSYYILKAWIVLAVVVGTALFW